MIGYLTGTVILSDSPHILIDVSGVGYRVHVPKSLIGAAIGTKCSLYIHTHVREEALDLYGFSTIEELKLFERLTSISGIGPKTAINIFSYGSSRDIVNAIIKADMHFFTAVPRLGKKNAQKIIIELKNKIADGEVFSILSVGDEEVFAALSSFGFSHQEVRAALKEVDRDATTEYKIKHAFKRLGK